MQLKGTANKLKVLIALIFIFQGLSIAVLSHPLLKIHPWMRLVGFGMLLVGLLFLFRLYKTKEEEKETDTALTGSKLPVSGFPAQRRAYRREEAKSKDEIGTDTKRSIVNRIMYKFTHSAKKLSFLTLPVMGALIIDAVFMYNYFTGQGLSLASWDIITIMLGASLIAYNFIPEKYGVSRDFIVFFLAILFIILVFPKLFYSFLVGPDASPKYTRILLANPVSFLLNVFNIESSTALDPVTGYAVINYRMADGSMTQVGITEACSGIYTTSIFISAFITYILVEYQKINLKVIIILIIGIVASYMANILRMTIITGIGHYYGTQALLDAHANAGWLIFMAWIIPFWFLVFKYLIRDDLISPDLVPT